MQTAKGVPYASANDLGHMFIRWCREAGLPEECTAHGVRKCAATMMAESGLSERFLCSVFGWKVGSTMAKLYTDRADQTKMSGVAISKLPSVFKGDDDSEAEEA